MKIIKIELEKLDLARILENAKSKMSYPELKAENGSFTFEVEGFELGDYKFDIETSGSYDEDDNYSHCRIIELYCWLNGESIEVYINTVDLRKFEREIMAGLRYALL